MNKIIISALTMLTLGLTQADYTLKYPLEASRGGSLPNGSINIKTPTPIYPNTHACFIDNYPLGLNTITLNGMCTNGVFTAQHPGGLGTVTRVGTCNDGNYNFTNGLAVSSGTCRTQ